MIAAGLGKCRPLKTRENSKIHHISSYVSVFRSAQQASPLGSKKAGLLLHPKIRSGSDSNDHVLMRNKPSHRLESLPS